MNKLYAVLLLGICCAAPQAARSQTIENVRTSFDGEKVAITYDLVYSDATQKFNVSLYSSHDNYQRPLSLLMGAGGFGDNVLPGKTIRVIWDAKSELSSDFNQDITIKVKATKVAPVMQRVNLSMKPFDQNVYKKGKSLEIKWIGGVPADKVNIQLFNKDNEVDRNVTMGAPNDQHYSWAIPQKIKSGKGYFIRISNSDKPTELSNSQFIQIKPRTPLVVKVLPFLAVGAIIYVLTKPKETQPDLPGLTIIPN